MPAAIIARHKPFLSPIEVVDSVCVTTFNKVPKVNA